MCYDNRIVKILILPLVVKKNPFINFQTQQHQLYLSTMVGNLPNASIIMYILLS